MKLPSTRLFFGMACAVLSFDTASAQVLLQIDISNTHAVTITATSNNAAATYNNGVFYSDGFVLGNLLTGSVDATDFAIDTGVTSGLADFVYDDHFSVMSATSAERTT